MDEETAKLREKEFIAAFRELPVEAGVDPRDELCKQTEEPQTPDLILIRITDVDGRNYCSSKLRYDTID